MFDGPSWYGDENDNISIEEIVEFASIANSRLSRPQNMTFRKAYSIFLRGESATSAPAQFVTLCDRLLFT